MKRVILRFNIRNGVLRKKIYYYMCRKKERFVKEKIASLGEFIGANQLIVLFCFLVQNLSNEVKTRGMDAVFSEKARTDTTT
ncbi:hypothetical protein [Priestia megaterium]|uniref:hypothetical protein n=1 Tax=Priestia megaterium TaxID=1404 RepID=UPI00301304DE